MILYEKLTKRMVEMEDDQKQCGSLICESTEEQFREDAEALAERSLGDVIFLDGKVWATESGSFVFAERTARKVDPSPRTAEKAEENPSPIVPEKAPTPKVEKKKEKEKKTSMSESIFGFLKRSSCVQLEESIIETIMRDYRNGVPVEKIKQCTDLSDVLIDDIITMYKDKPRKRKKGSE